MVKQRQHISHICSIYGPMLAGFKFGQDLFGARQNSTANGLSTVALLLAMTGCVACGTANQARNKADTALKRLNGTERDVRSLENKIRQLETRLRTLEQR